MRRLLLIGCICSVSLFADDYFVDDVYYLPDMEVLWEAMKHSVPEPYYNKKKMREIVFIVNDTSSVPVDTLSVNN